MSAVIGNPLLVTGADGYQISRSVRFRSSAGAYFSRTPAAASNRTTWTWSGWAKRGALGGEYNLFNTGTTAPNYDGLRFLSDSLSVFISGGSPNPELVTQALFRDAAAWYHIVLVADTTNATASSRLRLYVNNTLISAFSSAIFPAQNSLTTINSAQAHTIGIRQYPSAIGYYDGYLTEVNFIDGQALTPSSFGETDTVTGAWKPKKYTGTYGTNGFYLPFSDNSAATATAIGKDSSGNGNNWAPNNISLTAGSTYDSMLDVPTMWADGGNGRGNYAAPSQVDKHANIALANASLTATNSGGASWGSCRASIAVSSGKWYWEVDESYSSGAPVIVGIADAAFNVFTQRAGDTSGSYVLQIADGNKGNNGSFTSYAGATIPSGRNIGVGLDLDSGTLTFYNNGVSLGVAYSGISGTFAPVLSIYGTQGGTLNFNFGQRPFAYTPPAGFKALHTGNLPEPSIKKPNQWFDVSTWTGDNTTNRTIANPGGFQPDLVWTKGRSTTWENFLQDAVRGAPNFLISNSTNAEATTSPNIVSSFAANGFVVQNNGNSNASGSTYVAWQWKEGATPGFDIVTYTGNGVAGRQVPHSLGVKPAMFIIKNRSAGATNWVVWHKAISQSDRADSANFELNGFTGATHLNLTNAAFTYSFDAQVNGNGNNLVAYLFSEVPGFSRFGSYVGNGSADGPFVYCGFRPRYFLVKRTDTTSNWLVYDSARSPINVSQEALFANDLSQESLAASAFDLVSNGVKVRHTAGLNVSSGTYIFAAFAESPFKTALAR